MLKKKFKKSSFRHSNVGKVAQNVAVYAFGPLLQLILISIILALPVSQKKGARLGDSMGTMQVFHGSDVIRRPFVGMCLTADRKAAAHYGCEIAEFFLEVSSNLKVVDCNNLVDRDNQDYPGDTNASLAALQSEGVDVAVYIDETACGRSHTTYRLISDAAVASVASVRYLDLPNGNA